MTSTDNFADEAQALLRDSNAAYMLRDDPNGIWTLAVPESQSLAEQGWKLHISASEEDAVSILQRCLPILFSEHARFKFASSLTTLRMLNNGHGGQTQVGKFITVYPQDDEEAVTLARKLDCATSGLKGPRVPSDRQLRPGSRVSYRYGAFTPQLVRTPVGEVMQMYVGDDGSLVPDRRLMEYAAPVGLEDPFLDSD